MPLPFESATKRSRLQALTSSEHGIMAIMAVLVGLAGGFGAVGFCHLIDFFQTLSYGSAQDLLQVVATTFWYQSLLTPAVGGLVVGVLVFFLAREAIGHGVPEVMEAVALKGGLIRKRIVTIKSLASAICIGTGGSVGREGPIVQIGSAIGSTNDNLYTALEKISLRDFSILPLVSPEAADKLVGVLTRRDILGAYDKAVIKKTLFNDLKKGMQRHE